MSEPVIPERITPAMFAVLMQRELDANAHKGSWDEWRPSPGQAYGELEHHRQKLVSALNGCQADRLVECAADVANICMKIAETFGEMPSNLQSAAEAKVAEQAEAIAKLNNEAMKLFNRVNMLASERDTQAAIIERLTEALNVAKVRSESIIFTYEVPSRWKKQKSAWESGYEAGWRGWILRNPYTSVHHQDAYANGYRVAEQSVALKSAALSKQEPK